MQADHIRATQLQEVGVHELLRCPIVQPAAQSVALPLTSVLKAVSIVHVANQLVRNKFAHEHISAHTV